MSAARFCARFTIACSLGFCSQDQYISTDIFHPGCQSEKSFTLRFLFIGLLFSQIAVTRPPIAESDTLSSAARARRRQPPTSRLARVRIHLLVLVFSDSIHLFLCPACPSQCVTCDYETPNGPYTNIVCTCMLSAIRSRCPHVIVFQLAHGTRLCTPQPTALVSSAVARLF